MYFNSLPSGCVTLWWSLKLVMLECTAYGASNLLDDVVIGEWIIASIYCMKFSFSSVNSVWHNYIVPLQCADIINNYWLRIVADASHSFQWCGWWWWWSSTTTHTNGIDSNACGRTAHYGRGPPYDCESGGRGPRQGPEPNQYSDFKDFLDTKPSIFKEAEEPL